MSSNRLITILCKFIKLKSGRGKKTKHSTASYEMLKLFYPPFVVRVLFATINMIKLTMSKERPPHHKKITMM